MDDRARRRLFDRAVAHFNGRRFYEAHEDWEVLWHDEPPGPARRWLQGLIQVAAAFFHFERGFHASGFAKLLGRARENAASFEGDTLGLDFPRLLSDLEPWFDHGRAVAAGRPLRETALPLPRIEVRPEAGDPDANVT